MDTILIYDKETGNIEGATNIESIDLFLAGNLSPVLVSAKIFNDSGEEIGQNEVHLFDPDSGFLWQRNGFPSMSKGLVYVTTKSEEEIKVEEIPDIVYPEKKIPLVVNGSLSEGTYVLQRTISVIKEIDGNTGKVTEKIKKRKRIKEEHYSDLITSFTLDGYETINSENESEVTTKLVQDFKVEVNSETNTKRLVARG